MNTISIFKGKYNFLSNFFTLEVPIAYNGISYPTVEHFYQAMKSLGPTDPGALNPVDRIIIAGDSSPFMARNFGRTIRLRPDWENAKISVMRLGLILKFAANPELKTQLLSTWESVLVEGNHWHDNIWGNCMCPKCANTKGQNLLGYLLMEVRELFRLIK
ncbi:NADAR family protein [candidate division WOR-3 bacterium]|nr:NADAR family protein [candidate division WOR-3 bacterium]